jgi:3-phenylpropionate/cinnamic acid dioxygenase small subunit
VDLETLEDVRRLKYRYLRTLDTKQWDDFADTLAPDVEATYGKRLSFTGRDAVVEYMRTSLPPTIITIHQCHHPEIELVGDPATSAKGTWYLYDKVLVLEHRLMLTGAAFYDDEYVRGEDGRWRIARTSYVRSYEAMEKLSDTWHLTANRWAPAGSPEAVEQ